MTGYTNNLYGKNNIFIPLSWLVGKNKLTAGRTLFSSYYFTFNLFCWNPFRCSWISAQLGNDKPINNLTPPKKKQKQMKKHDEGYSSGTGGIWRRPAGNYNVQAAPRAAPSSASLTSFEELNCVWRRSDVGRREVHCWHRRPHDQMDERIIIAPPRRDRGPLRVSLGPAAIFWKSILDD